MSFDQPSMGEMFKAADHVGRLVLFENVGTPEVVTTANGDTPAIRADVTVLDGPGAPTELRAALIFGRALVGIVSRAGSGGLLGRVGQGQAKAGQNAPWILNEYAPEDGALAQRYVNERKSSQPAQPTSGTTYAQQTLGGTPINDEPPF